MNQSMVNTVIKGVIMKYMILVLLFVSCFEASSSDEAAIEKKMKELDDNTLLGPDKNNDGVRDDIEYWINNTSLIESNDIRRASMLIAKYIREGMKVKDDSQKSINNRHLGSKYESCYSNLFKFGDKKYKKIRNFIISNLLNTKDRIQANLEASQHFSGEIARSWKFADESCPFKLEGNYRKRRKRNEN